MSDENPLDFASMIAGQKAQGTKTPIEISTPAFRGVAQNFF
jgi:hypothetical protein